MHRIADITYASGPPWGDYVNDDVAASIAAAGAGSTIPLAMDADVRFHKHVAAVELTRVALRATW